MVHAQLGVKQMDLCAGSRPGHVEKGPDSLSRESRKKAHHSPITQLVEYQTVNLEVAGSIPAGRVYE